MFACIYTKLAYVNKLVIASFNLQRVVPCSKFLYSQMLLNTILLKYNNNQNLFKLIYALIISKN